MLAHSQSVRHRQSHEPQPHLYPESTRGTSPGCRSSRAPRSVTIVPPAAGPTDGPIEETIGGK
eukprot:1047176-Prymnesium_polylepis.1